MPWRKFATDWISALTGSQRATHVGTEFNGGYLLVQVDKPVSDGVVRVELPCGQKVRGRPAWSRQASDSDSETLVAFEPNSVGICNTALEELNSVPKTRTSPRVPVRLWVSFPDEPVRGTVTRDLSLEGCCLEGDFGDRVGQKMALYLDLYDNCDPLKLEAEVVWSASGESGFRFLNLHVADEVRLLKNLGKATTIAPSNFLPSTLRHSCPYTYRVRESDDETSLSVSVTNWNVRFGFKKAVVRGPKRGSFHRFQMFNTSGDIQQARARNKVSLRRQQKFLHLVFMDENDKVVFEIVGEETGFQREQRQVGVYVGEEVAS